MFKVDSKTNKLAKDDGTEPTPTEIEDLNKKIDEFHQKNSLVKQQVFSTISDQLLLCVQKLEGANEVWTEICQIHEGKMQLVQIDLQRHMQETRCEEGGDVKVHFAELLRLRESPTSMGVVINDIDFHTIILGSLPELYQPLLSSISAAAKITKMPLTSYELISIITEEYKHHQLTKQCRPRKKPANSALAVRESRGKGKSVPSSAKSNPDAICYNCDRKGHYKTDCWCPGGGKEGQGPHQQRRKGEKVGKQAANSATKSTDTHDQYAFVTSDLANIAKNLGVPAEKRGTIMDSGATSHFCPDHLKFTNFEEITPQDIHTAESSTLSAIGRGDVLIDLPLGEKQMTVTLKNALYAPTMVFTLISTNHITLAGLAVLFEGQMCKILSQGPKRRVIAEIPQVEGLYSVNGAHQKHHAKFAKSKLTINALHKVLGHVSQQAVVEAVKKGLVIGLELDKNSKPKFCDTCVKAKSARKSFPTEMENRALTYGELVHTNLWGPTQTASINRSLYYISFTDNFSRQTKLQFLKLKSKALTTFKAYV
jgi:hypothetical protein